MILERLKQKNIIVTGGTQGLGRGIALRLAEEGACGIAICGRNRANGEAAAEEIRKAGSGENGPVSTFPPTSASKSNAGRSSGRP